MNHSIIITRNLVIKPVDDSHPDIPKRKRGFKHVDEVEFLRTRPVEKQC